MSDDGYDDVRAVDPAFDDVVEHLTPDEVGEYAELVRGSTGYAVHRAGLAWSEFMAAWAKSYHDAGAALLNYVQRK